MAEAGDIQVQVRQADSADIAAILRIWSIARSPVATTNDDSRTLETLLKQPSSALFIAHFQGSIVGTAIAAWDGWRGHIYRVVVLPDYRRRGIGGCLVARGHEWLRESGARRVNVSVGESDPGPIAFWLAVGYQRDPDISRYAKTL